MAAVYPKYFPVIKGIVLMIMRTIFTVFLFHTGHLTNIIEFITLNVNRVFNSMLCYTRGDFMSYTARIRALREDNDMTQAKIAQLLQVGQKTYSDYELGKTRIPIDSLIVLAKLYNVSMDYICGVSDIRRPFPEKQR